MPFEMGAAKYDGTTPMVDEYTIERRDGKTVLRLVSSGIPNEPEWDGFYNGTDSGWSSFFRTLRHYLEHHGGRPRTTIKVIGKASGSPDDIWARLAAAVKPTGTIVFEKAPTILEMTIPELGDAYLWHSMSCAGANNYVYTLLSVYGKTPAEVEAIRAKWQPWLEQVLGVEAPSPTSFVMFGFFAAALAHPRRGWLACELDLTTRRLSWRHRKKLCRSARSFPVSPSTICRRA